LDHPSNWPELLRSSEAKRLGGIQSNSTGEDIILLAHIEVHVRMIVWGQRTHAMEGGHADLDAARSDFVEKQG